MSVSTNSNTPPRVPPPVNGIQVNFCKNPTCANYGVPASAEKQPRGPGAKTRNRDNYTVKGSGYSEGRTGTPTLFCEWCKETPPIKSNQGIHEEVARISAYLRIAEPSCPSPECSNHDVGLSHGKGYYYSKGPTAAGSHRYQCRACSRSFTVNNSKPAKNHLLPHKNSEVYSLLVNAVPMRRICKIAGINQKTLYDKIRFIHRQVMAFVARRERRLLTGELPLDKLYVSVDRQDHMVNWANRKDKRQTQFQAVESADNVSSYVFGIHLNYDPALDPEGIETTAKECGDYGIKAPFRAHARLWLQGDYQPATAVKAQTASLRQAGGHAGLCHEIDQTYNEATLREDVESCDLPAQCTKFPSWGMQVHAEYTLYGHFYFLRELFRHVGKLRFFLDQESGIRAACLTAFQERIVAREGDAFYVSINKTMTNDAQEKTMRDVRKEIEALAAARPYGLSFKSLHRLLIAKAIPDRRPSGPWKDMWADVLSSIKSEPEKKVCHLTDFGDYDVDRLAALFDKVSLHGIDRFFAQIRNSLSLLSRAPSSASNTGRKWYQRNAYNPEVVAMLLDIYRVHYNYLEAGEDKQTPAMRLGLAKSKVRLTDILTFNA